MAFACKPRNEDAGSAVKADGDAAPGTGGFDVNDVSFLFAKTGDGAFYPNVDATTVWPSTAFADLISFGKNKNLNGVQFGQIIIPKKDVALFDQYTANPNAPANDPQSKALKAIAAEMARNQSQCQLYKGGPAKICIDASAQLNFGNHRDAIESQANWRIVSARMDLCAGAHNDKKTQCEVEFRLIAQPWGDFPPQPPVNGVVPPLTTQPGQRGPHLFDVTAHLLYKVGTLDVATGNIKDETGKVVSTAQAIIQDLQALKAASTVSTDGKPLGVHPGIKAEAAKGDGPFGQAMQSLIQKYTGGGSKMTQVTSMHLAGATVFDSSVWVFYQGKVKGGRWNPIPITGSDVIFSIRSASVKGAGGKMFPPPEYLNRRISIDPIFDFEQGQTLPPNVVDLPAFFDNPGRYGDPKLLVGKQVASSVNNTDCISCHMTETRAYEWGISGVGPSTYQPPVGTTAYLDPEVIPRIDYNLRNFGYFLPAPLVTPLTGNEIGLGIFNFVGTRVEQPAVMTRVVHESAELVNMINTLYLKKKNPGLVCANEDLEGAFAASENAAQRYSVPAQQIIRRTAAAHAAVHDCLLYQSFKAGGSFASCAQACTGGGPGNTVAGGTTQIIFTNNFNQPTVQGQLARGQQVTLLYDKNRLGRAFPNCVANGQFSGRLVPNFAVDGGKGAKVASNQGKAVDVTKAGVTYASFAMTLPAGKDLALWFTVEGANKQNCGVDSNLSANYHFQVN